MKTSVADWNAQAEATIKAADVAAINQHKDGGIAWAVTRPVPDIVDLWVRDSKGYLKHKMTFEKNTALTIGTAMRSVASGQSK